MAKHLDSGFRDINGNVITEATWSAVNETVKGFWRRNPQALTIHLQNMAAIRTKFGLATTKDDLEKAGFRHIARIPEIWDRKSEKYIGIQAPLEQLLPGVFTAPNKWPNKKNRLLQEFLKRHPEFQVPDKL